MRIVDPAASSRAARLRVPMLAVVLRDGVGRGARRGPLLALAVGSVALLAAGAMLLVLGPLSGRRKPARLGLAPRTHT